MTVLSPNGVLLLKYLCNAANARCKIIHDALSSCMHVHIPTHARYCMYQVMFKELIMYIKKVNISQLIHSSEGIRTMQHMTWLAWFSEKPMRPMLSAFHCHFTKVCCDALVHKVWTVHYFVILNRLIDWKLKQILNFLVYYMYMVVKSIWE